VFAADAPSGATVTPGTSEGATANQTAGSADAYAGNVTELTIYGDAITSAWQGYFGQVSGVIRLANAAGNAMYNWSFASPDGEVYATTAGSVAWDDITCFDVAANGPALETTYGITPTDGDRVGETFSSTYGSDLIVGRVTVSGCDSVQLFGSGGAPTFDEVILTADTGTTPIFTSILKQDTAGFDGGTYDFEMLVLDNGHNGDTNPTTYNFYVEIV
jgi:hypothetical protein